MHKEALAWHTEKVHEGPKKCPHCDYASAHRSCVALHVRKFHTNKEELFKCELCEEAFAYIRDSLQHTVNSDMFKHVDVSTDFPL